MLTATLVGSITTMGAVARDGGNRQGAAHGVRQPPRPDPVSTVDDLLHRLRLVRLWAGNPPYQEIARRIDKLRGEDPARRMARSTVADYFVRSNRRRLDYDLVFDILRALGLTEPELEPWRQAWQEVFAPTDPASAVAVEFGLPPDTPNFTGRADQVCDLLTRTRGVTLIEGMAGVGKTQLVIHVGHQLARAGGQDHIQLYANLRGYDADRAPAEAGAVLVSFLRGLGVAANRIPPGPAARAAMYRTVLRGRGALVILDNAASEEQIQPLLADGPNCLTLVTSRSHLAGVPHATVVSLDVFPAAESVDLLARIIGPDRVAAEPDAAARIADLCGHLPIALTLVAHQIAARPAWSLYDHASRLEALGIQDGVRRAFLGSYQGLPADHQRAVLLCALHPGHDLTRPGVAALMGTGLDDAGRTLDDLVLSHLLQERPGCRYEFHDVVRACMTELLHDVVPGSQQRSALTRLLDYYRYAAGVAMECYAPHESATRPAVAVPGHATVVRFADGTEATAWLDAERDNLVAAAVLAADHGWPDHAVDLSRIMHRYLDTGGFLHHAELLHASAVRAASDDDKSQVLNTLASVYWRLGRYDEVLALLRQALLLFRKAADEVGQARCLINIGIAYWRMGQYEHAIEHQLDGLAFAQRAGDRVVEAKARNNLGTNYWRLGRYAEALDHQTEALKIVRDVEDRVGECRILNNIAAVHLRLGRYEQACGQLGEVIERAREIGDWETESNGLTNLGIAQSHLGHGHEAVDLHQRALEITRRTGNRDGEATILNDLGDSLHRMGHPVRAVESHTAALAIAGETGNQYEQARAYAGLARCVDDRDVRRGHAASAVAGFTRLAAPEAAEVAALLG